mmetsp:Transcript_9115/g.10493  ORF Transcript_9115/g.10493 Transcript_9115/m.10493 type:complete len:956 (+) Transcript_9115:224-3091(+)
MLSKTPPVRFTQDGLSDSLKADIASGKLKDLNLKGNDFSQAKPLDELCDILRDPACKLQMLTLSNSKKLCPEPLGRILQSIRANSKTRLIMIDMQNSGVDDEGAEFVAKLIEENTSLNVINLNSSKFGAKALYRIEEAYRTNYYLEELYFSSPNLKNANLSVYDVIARNKRNNGFKGIIADSLQAGSSCRWGRSKLMVIGQGGAGKTSTVRALLGQTFNPNWDSTVGADLKKTDTSGWNETEIQSSDFTEAAARAVREEHKKRIEEFEKNQKRIIIGKGKGRKAKTPAKKAASKKEEKTVTKAQKDPVNVKKPKKEKAKVKTEARPTGPNPVVDASEVYGNDDLLLEKDLEPENPEKYIGGDNSVKLVDETDVARRFGNKLLNQAIHDESYDDPDKLTFTIWDYGGQTVFYTLHHLFLTKYGVYLLVFDLNKVLNLKQSKSDKYDAIPESIEYLRFWINSVMLHAPSAPVLLVGTHLDGVEKALSKSSTTLDMFYQQVQDTLVNIVKVERHKALVKNGKLCFYPVNNAQGIGVSELRTNIENSVKGKYYVDQKIPLRWVLTCDKMVEDEEFQSEWHSLVDVESWAKECGCKNVEEEVPSMLKLFHELGVLIYLSSTGALRDRIISDPQWLLTKLGMIIRDDMHGMPPHVPQHLEDEWDELRRTGIVSMTLLEVLFGDPVGDKTLTQAELDERERDAEFLVDLMKHAMLLSDWNWKKSTGNDRYFIVPSLLKDSEIKSREVGKMLKRHSNPAILYVDFSEFFLPIGVFQRFVCMLINMVGRLGDSGYKKESINEPFLGAEFAFVQIETKSKNSKQKSKKDKTSSDDKSSDTKNDAKETLKQDDNIEIFIHVIEKDRIQMIINRQELAPDCLNMMVALMRKLREEVMGTRLKMKLLLERNVDLEEGKEKKVETKEFYDAKEDPEYLFWFESAKTKKSKKKEKETKVDLDNFLLTLLE